MEDFINSINAGNSELLAQVKAGKPGPKRPYKPRGVNVSEKLRGSAGAVNTIASEAPGAGAAGKGDGAKGGGGGRAGVSGVRAAAGSAAAGGAGAAGAAAAPASTTLGQRLKMVLEELKRSREILGPIELQSRLKLDVPNDEDLQSELARHPNVECIAGQYRYRPKTPGINNKEDLLRYLRQMSTVEGAGEKGLVGVKIGQIDDAYNGVEEDMKALHKEGRIFRLDHTTIPADSVLFFNETDPGLGLLIQTTPDVVSLFHDTNIPAHVRDLEQEVAKLGLKSMISNRPKLEKLEKLDKDKKKRKREVRINIGKATNAHLPELFMGNGPTEIDRRD